MADEATQATARTDRDSTTYIRRLVERGQQGERGALEELYLLHFDRIYSYLHMSVGNRHDAEDLTTQTFLKMLESIGRFRWQSAPFSPWIISGPTGAGSPRRRCPSRRGRRSGRPRTRRCTRSGASRCSS